MTVLRAFTIVILSALGFGLAGSAIGYTLGRVAPGYYRTVFPNNPALIPEEVGLGLGLTQGVILGVVVGLVVVVAVAWYQSRRSDSSRPSLVQPLKDLDSADVGRFQAGPGPRALGIREERA